MYYPLFRGRQFDLLALRELKNKKRLSPLIIPIIEPIKLSSTLVSTIDAFEMDSSKLIVISNPKVGSLQGELSIPSVKEQYKKLMSSPSVLMGHYFNKDSQKELSEITMDFGRNLTDLAILHSERSLVPNYNRIFSDLKPSINIIPSDNAFRRQLSKQNLVLIEDKFNKLSRNADYLENELEFFSEEHLFFMEEGYSGFSDYSVVGKDYNEGGFAPYAVAIHIVFPNADRSLEIYHFVSDSNEDISNPAGKFYEALEKLYKWHSEFKDERINTLAMSIFIDHYKNGTYPGLPTIKKLSIMHHLELVGILLEEEHA